MNEQENKMYDVIIDVKHRDPNSRPDSQGVSSATVEYRAEAGSKEEAEDKARTKFVFELMDMAGEEEE